MIAFYLQKAGGITVVWKELITRMLRDRQDIVLILQNTECENIYFRQIMEYEPKTLIENGSKVKINRYMPVNCHFEENSSFVSTYYRIPKEKQIKQYTLVHDFTYEHYVKGIRKLVHAFQKKNSVRHSDVIICVSENTKSDLLKFYSWSNDKKIHVIYNGVSDVYRHIDNVTEIKALGKYNNEPFFLFVGSRAKYKRFDFAVDVSAKYKFGLVIIGGGKLTESETTELDSKLGDNYIQLLGIEDEELNLIYNKAFALLYPSEYEGFGIPIIEAQKAGCHVIAKDSSSVSEIITDDAILMKKCTLKEAERVINLYKADRERLINKGYENSEKFSWEKTYQEYKDMLFYV